MRFVYNGQAYVKSVKDVSFSFKGQGRRDREMPAGNNQPDSREMLEPPTTRFSASVVGRWECEGKTLKISRICQRTKTWTPVSQEMLLPKMPENVVQNREFSGRRSFAIKNIANMLLETPKRRCNGMTSGKQSGVKC